MHNALHHLTQRSFAHGEAYDRPKLAKSPRSFHGCSLALKQPLPTTQQLPTRASNSASKPSSMASKPN
jgi:hypothetical protein